MNRCFVAHAFVYSACILFFLRDLVFAVVVISYLRPCVIAIRGDAPSDLASFSFLCVGNVLFTHGAACTSIAI